MKHDSMHAPVCLRWLGRWRDAHRSCATGAAVPPAARKFLQKIERAIPNAPFNVLQLLMGASNIILTGVSDECRSIPLVLIGKGEFDPIRFSRCDPGCLPTFDPSLESKHVHEDATVGCTDPDLAFDPVATLYLPLHGFHCVSSHLCGNVQ